MNRPSSPPLDDRERIALFEAMDGLDDRERALLLEHYFEKVPLADLGERRGISAVAIWKRIDRAREKLKKTLLGAGFVLATSSVAEALEATVPVAAPPTLVGEAILGKILAGGLIVGVTKSSVIPAVVLTLILLIGISTGGYLIFRSRGPQVLPKAGHVTTPKPVATSAVPAASIPSDSGNSSSGEAVGPKNALLETLTRYRAWHERWKQLTKTPPPPDDPQAHLRLQNEGWSEFKEAYAQINEDPATFLKFIQDPANEELVGRMIINLLGKLEALGLGTGRNAQYYKDFSQELLDGMVGLLKSGTLKLRTGILEFMSSIHDVPGSYDALYEELMYDPDPSVQYLALWARWRQRPLDLQTLEKILARYQSSPDRLVRQTAIRAISYSPKPETFQWMLDSLESSKDPEMSHDMAKAAATMAGRMTLDTGSADRLVSALIKTCENTTEEHRQNWLLWSALHLPVNQSVRVLEAALPKAATPKLKAAIQSTLAKAGEGSPTWNDLQNHFWRLMKD